MGYRNKVIAGFSWQIGLKFGLAILALIKIFFLSRLLSPTEFGVFALIAIALGISEAVTQTGINITILQVVADNQRLNRLINTAWLVAMVRGLLIALILFMIGFLLSLFFSNPDLIRLTALASLVPVIKGFINPSIVLWQKNLQFHNDTYFHLTKQVVEVVSTVVLALVWQSVEVFIWGMIIAAGFEAALSWVTAKPRPKLSYDNSSLQLILQNAKGLSITAALSYLSENLDDLILGKTLGTYQLGLYHNAYTLTHKLNYEPTKAANYSLMAIYTKLTVEKTRLWQAFRQAFGLITLGLGAITLLMIFLRQTIVDLALGITWQAVVPLIPWLALAGLAQSLVALIYTLQIAQKKYRLVNWHLLATVLILSISLYWTSVTSGILMAVMALAVTRWFLLIPLILFTIKYRKTGI